MSKVKASAVSEWVTQWVTRSPIELFWTAKNIPKSYRMGKMSIVHVHSFAWMASLSNSHNNAILPTLWGQRNEIDTRDWSQPTSILTGWVRLTPSLQLILTPPSIFGLCTIWPAAPGTGAQVWSLPKHLGKGGHGQFCCHAKFPGNKRGCAWHTL